MQESKSIRDIYPGAPDAVPLIYACAYACDYTYNYDCADKQRQPSVNGPINYARPRPFRVPRVMSERYLAYKGKQECALKISVWDFEENMKHLTKISRFELCRDKLTVRYDVCSQSKLSQQELSDLQKATHFDKKELQQWHKGGVAPLREPESSA